MKNRTAGFTPIELLIVVVIIGLLASIAIPKFASTRDKSRLASVKTDLRNIMTAQEAYFADNSTYGNLTDIRTVTNFNLTTGNTATITPGLTGYTANVNNSFIATGMTQCQVTAGNGAPVGVDGVMICS